MPNALWCNKKTQSPGMKVVLLQINSMRVVAATISAGTISSPPPTRSNPPTRNATSRAVPKGALHLPSTVPMPSKRSSPISRLGSRRPHACCPPSSLTPLRARHTWAQAVASCDVYPTIDGVVPQLSFIVARWPEV
jgi:hypothetical protein